MTTMTGKQKAYLVALIKKVFKNEESQAEMLGRLERADVTSAQASTMIHALKRERNIYRTLPSCMWGATNLNSLMEEFFVCLGFDK